MSSRKDAAIIADLMSLCFGELQCRIFRAIW